MILAPLLGLVILSILTALPFIGFLAGLVIAHSGLGAIRLGLERWRKGYRPVTID